MKNKILILLLGLSFNLLAQSQTVKPRKVAVDGSLLSLLKVAKIEKPNLEVKLSSLKENTVLKNEELVSVLKIWNIETQGIKARKGTIVSENNNLFLMVDGVTSEGNTIIFGLINPTASMTYISKPVWLFCSGNGKNCSGGTNKPCQVISYGFKKYCNCTSCELFIYTFSIRSDIQKFAISMEPE